MKTSAQIAKHLREVYFGGNWTVSTLKEHLDSVTWEQAITKIGSLNTIAALVYHIGYYVTAVTSVLDKTPFTSKDSESFNHPAITNESDWQALQQRVFADAEKLCALIEQVPEEKLWDIFVNEQYGIYYRNFHGVIESAHYHLGQIVLVKKMITQQR